jgi:gliding motility-associated-like protein
MKNNIIKAVTTYIVLLCAALFYSSKSIAQCHVKLPKDFIECNNSAVSIQSNTDYAPIYSTNNASDKYLWTITGGPYSWFGGTNPTDRFPKINLQDGYIYTIVIQFTNSFGTCSDTQLVYRNVGLTAEINKPLQADTLVCFGTLSIDLSAYIQGPYTSFSWLSSGNGAFTQSNTLSPKYILSQADKDNGVVRIVFNAIANVNGSCFPNDTDTLTVNILKFVGKDSSVTVCSNTQLNYQPLVTGANQYSWTSQVISGSVTGNSPTGTGKITDSLINNSSSVDAVVRYTITPIFQQCSGSPVSYLITLKPRPAITASYTPALCTGTSSNIQLSTSLANTLYTWTSTVTSGSISGNSNATTPVSISSINDILVNNSPTSPSTIRYIITPYHAFGCAGQPIEALISVSPVVTISNAGADRMICLKDTIRLSGNIALSGPASWSQLSGPNTALINEPNNPITSVGNLVPGLYRFIWTVSNAICPSSRDTVAITISSPVVAGMIPKTANGCTGSNAGSFTLTNFNGTINRWEYSTNNGQSWSIINNTSNVQAYNNLTATTWYRAVVESGACGSVFTDTAIVTIYSLVTPANAGADRVLCLKDTIHLNGNNPTSGTGVWSQVSGPTVLINQSAIFNSSVSNLQPGNYSFVWVIGNGVCPSTRDTVSINISTPAIAGKLSGNATVCTGSNNGTITLTNYTGNIINWELSTNSGQGWTPVPGSTNTYSYTNLTTTTWFRTTVQSGACISGNSDTAIITVMPVVTPSNAGLDRLVCLKDTIQLSANTPSSGTGLWSQLSGPNTSSIAQPSSPSTTVTNLQAGSYRFVWTISNGVCPVGRDTVTIEISTPTIAGNITGDATVCTGNNSGIFLLNNYTGSILNWEYSTNNGQSWNNINNITNQQTYNNLTITTWYRAIVKSGACASVFSDTAIVTVFPLVTPANAGVDNSVCLPANVTLNGNTPTAGTGIWTQLSGPGAASINQPTNPGTTVSNLQPGLYQFVWTISNGVCPVSTDTVAIAVSSPVIAGMLPRTADGCTGNNSGSFTLTNYYGSILRWESSTNNGQTWNNISNTTNVQIYTNLTSTTWFRAIVQSGACGIAITDTAIVTIYSLVTPANAGADRFICLQDTIQLNANTPTSGTGIWSQLSGPTTASLNSPTNATTTVTNIQPGTYRFIWSISNNICETSRDTVSIVITAPIINRIDTTTQTVCRGRFVFVSEIDINGGNGSYQFQWEMSYDRNNWTIIPGATQSSYTFTADTSIFLRRVVSSSPCVSISDIVQIIVQRSIAQNIIQANQNICTGDTASVITGSVPTGGNNAYNYFWQQSTDGGNTWTIINAGFAKDYAPGLILQTTYYRRIVTSGSCNGSLSSVSNTVIITVNPLAKAAFTVTTPVGCAPFVIDSNIIKVERHDDVNKSYTWFANNIVIGTGAAFAGFVLDRPQDSVIIKLKVSSLFSCKDDSASYVIRVSPLPNPAFTLTDTTGCGPLTIGFTNQTPLVSQYSYLWNFGNGQTSSSQQPPAITFLPSSTKTDTSYTITLTAFNNCDTVSVTKTIWVRSKPSASFTVAPASGCAPLQVNFDVKLNSTNSVSRLLFGDGVDTLITASAQFSHIYKTSVTNTFNPKLITSNECGADSLSVPVQAITVDANLKFDIIDTAGCAPHNVSIINRSTGTVNYTWSLGDGSPARNAAVSDTIKHTYTQPGVYAVRLSAQHQCGGAILVRLVEVHELPTANFELITAPTCIGDSVRFTNTSNDATSYIWNFGNGSTSTIANPAHAYTTAGNYNVGLTAIKTYSTGVACRDNITNPVVIVDSQKGTMTVSDSTGTCLPFTATFINKNQPSALTTWKFGDGSSANGDTVVHTYTTGGIFTATMFAKSAGGCNYNDTVQVTILPTDGNLIYAAANYCGSNNTRFTARLQHTDSLIWHFGDGTILHTTDTIVNHSYLQPGTYLPWAELIGKEGCRKIIKGADSIRVEKIKAGFSWTTTNACTVSTLQFADTSRSHFGIDQWQWTFGDGSTGTGKNVQHQYINAGSYLVRLIVTSKLGCKDTITSTVNVVVYNKPVITIQNNNDACVLAPQQFTAIAQSVDSVRSYVWNMGNGQILQGKSINAVYSTAGIYTVTLIAGTINGCYDTATTSITVHPSPEFLAKKELQVCRGEQVILQSSNSSRVTWSNDQQVICTGCSEITVSPLTTTKYYVTGSSQYGCSSRDTVLVNIVQPFVMQTSGGDTLCVGEQSKLFAKGADKYRWSPAAGLSRTDIANPIANPSTSTTYTVIGYDANNCFSDTGKINIVVGAPSQLTLGADTTVMAGSSMILTSRVANGPAIKYAWSSPSQLSCVNCPQPVATVKHDECFSCTITNRYGCITTDTICVKTFCKSAQVFIPNAFSPDGDGVNDVFYVMGSGVKIVKSFMIFNRWGELLFQKENFVPNNPSTGWDGTIRGKKGSPEVYVYVCTVLCENDIQYSYKGNVAIIK